MLSRWSKVIITVYAKSHSLRLKEVPDVREKPEIRDKIYAKVVLDQTKQ